MPTTRESAAYLTPVSHCLRWFKSTLQHRLSWQTNLHLTAYREPEMNAARQAVLRKECPPSIRQLQKNFGLSRNKARTCLQELAQQGYLLHDKQAHEYRLNEQSSGIQTGFHKFVRKFSN